MVEILQSWIERQIGQGNGTPAAFGETLRKEYGDFSFPGMMELWITIQRSQGNIGPTAIGQTLIDQWGDFPLNDSPAKVLSRFSPGPIPLEWTEVPFTPAEERGKIEIYHSVTDHHNLVNIRCNDIVLNTHRLQLLDLRSRGFGNMAIAQMLHRSCRTVETNLARARETMQKGEENNHNLPTIKEFFVHCARIGLLDPNLIPSMKANFQLPAGSWYTEYSEDKPIEAEVLDTSGQKPIPRRMWTEVPFTPAEERGGIEIKRDGNSRFFIRCKDVELTWNQLRVLTLRTRGFENQAIAKRLGISDRTIDAHFVHARNHQVGEEEDAPGITQFFVHCARIGLFDSNLIPAMKANFQLPAKFLQGLD